MNAAGDTESEPGNVLPHWEMVTNHYSRSCPPEYYHA